MCVCYVLCIMCVYACICIYSGYGNVMKNSWQIITNRVGHRYMVIETMVLSVIWGILKMLLGQSSYYFRAASDLKHFRQESCTNHFRGTSSGEDWEFDGCATSMFDARHPMRLLTWTFDEFAWIFDEVVSQIVWLVAVEIAQLDQNPDPQNLAMFQTPPNERGRKVP